MHSCISGDKLTSSLTQGKDIYELEVQPKSYGLNLACQNGPAKDSERLQNLSPLNVESSGNIKTGLWKHETTV